MSSKHISPLVAEALVPNDLDKVSIDMEPLSSAYRGIMSGVEDVNSERVVGKWYAIIGLYGSGKTLLLRKIAHDAVNKFNKIIPIYFYMGIVDEMLLFKSLTEYVAEIEKYVVEGFVKVGKRVKIHGSREAWENKVKVLKEVVEETKSSGKGSDFELFIETMKKLNVKGYYPLIIFDEFERIIYTGEGFGTPPNPLVVNNFVLFANYFHELTRHILFSSVGVIALTDTLTNLIDKASIERPRHVIAVEETSKIKYTELKFRSPTIVFDGVYRLNWSAENLSKLCSKLGYDLRQEIIDVIAKIIPTPRAILSLIKKASDAEITLNTRKDIYKLIEQNIDELINRLYREKTSSGKPLLYSSSKWDEWFKKLISEGYFIITRDDLETIGKLLEPLRSRREEKEEVTERAKTSEYVRLKNIARNTLNKLVEYGLYENIGKGMYVVNRDILAYSLGIDRLPTGEVTTLDNLIKYICERVEARRRRMKEYRLKRSSKS